jgi:hypothetical protein
VLLGDRAERDPLNNGGIGEDDVDASLFLADLPVDPVQVLELGDVPPDGGDAGSDGRRRSVQFRLTAAGDVNPGAFPGELSGGGQADAGAGRSSNIDGAGGGAGVPLAVVCHASAALLATRDANGKSPFAGYRITGYTNDDEEAVGLASRAKWLMEDEVKKFGVEFSRGPICQPYTVVDRNRYTLQNPASAGPLAQEPLKVLN